MFLNDNIDETFIQQFAALGVTNENDIVTILNGFDQIAEIGYAWYVNNKANKLNNNDKKEKESRYRPDCQQKKIPYGEW